MTLAPATRTGVRRRGPVLLGYLLKRSAQALLFMLLVVVINFGLLHAIPGDLVDVMTHRRI